jgi:hypothetical protein
MPADLDHRSSHLTPSFMGLVIGADCVSAEVRMLLLLAKVASG